MAKTVLGAYNELALWAEAQCERRLSFLHPQWDDVEAWKARARAKVHECLSYTPPSRDLQATVTTKQERDDLVVEEVRYEQPFGPPTEAFLLRPSSASEQLPAVVALHDHSAFKYFGKEKLVAVEREPDALTELKKEIYGGRSWATELAKRGYVVLVPDLFLWGSRRMDPRDLPNRFVSGLEGLEPESRPYIEAYNKLAADHESVIAKALFLSGVTWPGIMAYEDRRAVDYLRTRSEVDPQRIGCGGLSGGGLRSIYLAGLDERIRCAVCVGFMTVDRELIAEKVFEHTWMFQVPELPKHMDLPDIASMHGPSPLMVQYDRDDPLWTLAGQEQAHRKLIAVYAKMGAPDLYNGRFYDGPHKFDVTMQEDAFAWFDRWLM